MIYVDKRLSDLFQDFFKDNGGMPWSEAGEYSYARTLFRGKVVFKQPFEDGSFNVGGDGEEQLGEAWGEFVKFLNESEDLND